MHEIQTTFKVASRVQANDANGAPPSTPDEWEIGLAVANIEVHKQVAMHSVFNLRNLDLFGTQSTVDVGTSLANAASFRRSSPTLNRNNLNRNNLNRNNLNRSNLNRNNLNRYLKRNQQQPSPHEPHFIDTTHIAIGMAMLAVGIQIGGCIFIVFKKYLQPQRRRRTTLTDDDTSLADLEG